MVQDSFTVVASVTFTDRLLNPAGISQLTSPPWNVSVHCAFSGKKEYTMAILQLQHEDPTNPVIVWYQHNADTYARST